MTDDVRRAQAEEERARLFEARNAGGLCGACGRALAADEPVWWVRFALPGAYGQVSYQSGPVGRECAPLALPRETDGAATEWCVGCGRGVYYQAEHRLRRVPACSRRCAGRYRDARAKETRGS